jgi:hypothetical protein
MPTGGKLCLSHRRCSEELDPVVVNFLVPAYWLFLAVRSAVGFRVAPLPCIAMRG